MSSRWADDDELIAALDEALRAARGVPREFIEMGKIAYVWRNIDAELAALSYDSTAEETRTAAVTRAEPAPIRALTFASDDLEIELEVTHEELRGQIVPPQSGSVDVHLASGEVLTAPIDELGWFVIQPIPPGSFRLHCRAAGSGSVLTGWIVL
jgi:hypothetical protein